MRRTAFLLLIVTASLQLAQVARAQQAHEQARVAVSWNGVRDADVQRCGLSRLRAGTIERLVAAGYAVVEQVDGSGVQVTVASVARGLQLQVAGRGVARQDALDPGPQCDATFVLDVIARIAELVDVVAAVPVAIGSDAASNRPQARAPVNAAADRETTNSLATTDAVRTQAQARADVQAELDFTARVNEAPDYQLGGGLGVRVRLPAAWEAGARAELTAHAEHGVTALEAFLGFGAAYQPSLPGVAPCIELGPLLHHAQSTARSITKLDFAIATGAQLSLGHLFAQLLIYGRLHSFAHRVGPTIAFDTGHVGLVLRIGAQLSGS